MAGDATIQTAIQTLLQALDRYAAGQVTLGDLRVLGSGKAAAVIFAGPFDANRPGDWGQVAYQWTHYVDVWRPFQGDEYADIVADRQAVLDTLNANPTLNGTADVTDCLAQSSQDLQFYWPRGVPRDAKPALVGFRIRVRTVEQRGYAGAGEFA